MVRQPSLTERFLAETLGTFLLIFFGGGSAALATLSLRNGHPQGLADLVLVALAHGFGIFAAIMIIGKVSGAHINPAVTLALASIGRTAWEDVTGYLAGQILGALLGAGAILVVYGKFAATIGHLGAPHLSVGTSMVQGFFVEAIGAAILVISIVATAIDSRSPVGWAGLTVGLTLAALIMVLGPATGASLNPARAFGPDFLDVFFGVQINWVTYFVTYLLAPIVGGIAGAHLYSRIARMPRPKR